MQTRVFKFGGASVNSAEGVRNVTGILRSAGRNPLLLVISAMGKTTNQLELVLKGYFERDPVAMVEAFGKLKDYHDRIVAGLFPDRSHVVYQEIDSLFNQLRGYLTRGHLYLNERPSYDFEYDQVVGYGELFSTTILSRYLIDCGFNTRLFDACRLIRTDSTHRDARVDWSATKTLIGQEVLPWLTEQQKAAPIALTQGFVASDSNGRTTTLGREGSDFTAAIFAYCLGTSEMTIWKDVPGVLNADPKWFPNPKKLKTLSYREAIELAYYGASVIHPKTIKPLENGNITLRVKSFVDPSLPGTTIRHLESWKIGHPIFIRKMDQVLVSLSPRDFSFILEENLSQLFEIIAKHRMKVNLMQNSAISFSVCLDHDPMKLPGLLKALGESFEVRYNDGLELYTIRHYNTPAIRKITAGREVLMEQRSRNTLQLVVR